MKAISPLAALLMTVSGVVAGASAKDAADEKIPALASPNYGWQTNVADWQEPAAGTQGHGPIRPDPAHPFMSNAEAGRLGKQPTLRIGDAKDPVLKPWAAKFMADSNAEALSGKLDVPFASQARCFPGGVPGQLLFPFEPMYFVQTPTEVWMFWQRDHQIRRVFLNREHSKTIKPSWFGESVGHYEGGDTLVVDTIGLSANKFSYIDNFRTPHSDKEHVVERFTISPDGGSLTAIARVEDPNAYNAPITMMRTWFKADHAMEEVVCSENNGDRFNQGLVPIPEAGKPDF